MAAPQTTAPVQNGPTPRSSSGSAKQSEAIEQGATAILNIIERERATAVLEIITEKSFKERAEKEADVTKELEQLRAKFAAVEAEVETLRESLTVLKNLPENEQLRSATLQQQLHESTTALARTRANAALATTTATRAESERIKEREELLASHARQIAAIELTSKTRDQAHRAEIGSLNLRLKTITGKLGERERELMAKEQELHAARAYASVIHQDLLRAKSTGAPPSSTPDPVQAPPLVVRPMNRPPPATAAPRRQRNPSATAPPGTQAPLTATVGEQMPRVLVEGERRIKESEKNASSPLATPNVPVEGEPPLKRARTVEEENFVHRKSRTINTPTPTPTI